MKMFVLGLDGRVGVTHDALTEEFDAVQHVVESDVCRRQGRDIRACKKIMARVVHFVVAAADGVLL